MSASGVPALHSFSINTTVVNIVLHGNCVQRIILYLFIVVRLLLFDLCLNLRVLEPLDSLDVEER